MTTPDEDLTRIAEQENVLSFDTFDLTTAWQLGKLLQELGTERGLCIAIDITLHSMPVFYAALPGVTPDNVQWVRRKRNLVLRYFRSSYAIGVDLKQRARRLPTTASLMPIMRRTGAASRST